MAQLCISMAHVKLYTNTKTQYVSLKNKYKNTHKKQNTDTEMNVQFPLDKVYGIFNFALVKPKV